MLKALSQVSGGKYSVVCIDVIVLKAVRQVIGRQVLYCGVLEWGMYVLYVNKAFGGNIPVIVIMLQAMSQVIGRQVFYCSVLEWSNYVLYVNQAFGGNFSVTVIMLQAMSQVIGRQVI